MLLVRGARRSDLDDVMALARLSGRGFTSLPEDEATLYARLDLAERSFAGICPPTEAWYTLMLENTETRHVEGIAGVRAAVGLARPHFSFRVVTLTQSSPAVGTHFDHRALVLVNECSGWTEVGSLFLKSSARGNGAGKLLARSRYMLIGTEPHLFAPTVMAELRGWLDDAGHSPFWKGVTAKFFRLPFDEADRMVMSTDGQFILDLAPRHPIYVELIDPDACAAIGQVHRDGAPALAMLEREGFERSGLVDLFDGGPTMTCPLSRVETIRVNRTLRIVIGDTGDAPMALLSTARIADFKAVCAPAMFNEDCATIERATADALGLRDGDPVKVSEA